MAGHRRGCISNNAYFGTQKDNHERNATRRIQNAYGDKYDMLRMYDSKRSVANLLSEAAEERSVREKLRTIQKEQKSQQQKKPKYKDWER